MFARKVAARLKPNTLPQFVAVMETKILPWLRRQEGFLDLIVLSMHGSDEVAIISFWDHKSHAEAWAAANFADAVEALDKLLDGAPYVKTFDVVSSTLHELEGIVKTEAQTLTRPETIQ
ncbi:MAG TPA: antibiotic biosynthesis monooxygenase [Candidatus Binatia bacterium]|nr:antibiotic biosynthesis monooxygenase [Candidatus Binatia bacterium]